MSLANNIEFLRRLLERHYTGAVIIVSGEDEPILRSVEKLLHTHRINSLGYLRKPFNPEALSALLEQWRPAASSQPRRR